MGLFGSSNKDDTRAKIEELKAKMQGANAQPQQPQQQPQQQPPQQAAAQQQPWQQSSQQPPSQEQQGGWQPPREQSSSQQPAVSSGPTTSTSSSDQKGILLELGQGMSLNLPIKEKMRLDEFLQVADRVRELKKIDRS